MSAITDALAAQFNLQQRQARVLAVLYGARGRCIPVSTLARAVEAATINALDVQVCYLRKRVKGVDLTPDGYRLTDAAVEACRVAVLAHAVKLRADLSTLMDAVSGLGRAA